MHESTKSQKSFLVTIVLLFITACADSSNRLILGEWIQKDKNAEDRLVEFKSGGELIMYLTESEKGQGMPDSVMGTWELSHLGRLKMIIADRPVLARIESINELEMIIKFDKDKYPMLYKRKLN